MALELAHLGLLLLLTCTAFCEDWFMTNSRLISDVEFREAMKDQSTFKMVKFFTPHCVYCRYLKNVFDELKAEQHWSFEVYDLNCAWYPRLCNQELKIGSFPYTAIYDEDGKLDAEIRGFYPKPVIKDIFEQAERATQDIKARSTRNLNPHEEEPREEIKTLSEEADSKSQPNDLKMAEQTLPADWKTEQDTHQQSAAIEQEQASHPSEPTKPDAQSLSEPHKQTHAELAFHLPAIYQHVFFSVCILLGVIYFSSFMHLIKSPGSKLNPEALDSHSKMVHH